jgi:hypothetical protein
MRTWSIGTAITSEDFVARLRTHFTPPNAIQQTQDAFARLEYTREFRSITEFNRSFERLAEDVLLVSGRSVGELDVAQVLVAYE